MKPKIRIIQAKSLRQRKKQAKRLAQALGLKQTLFPTPMPQLRIIDEEGAFITGTAWPERQRKNCQLAFEDADPEGGSRVVMVTTGWTDAYRQLVAFATFDYEREVEKIPF